MNFVFLFHSLFFFHLNVCFLLYVVANRELLQKAMGSWIF